MSGAITPRPPICIHDTDTDKLAVYQFDVGRSVHRHTIQIN